MALTPPPMPTLKTGVTTTTTGTLSMTPPSAPPPAGGPGPTSSSGISGDTKTSRDPMRTTLP